MIDVFHVNMPFIFVNGLYMEKINVRYLLGFLIKTFYEYFVHRAVYSCNLENLYFINEQSSLYNEV